MTRVPLRRLVSVREVAHALRTTVLVVVLALAADTAWRYLVADPPDLRYAAPVLLVVVGLALLPLVQKRWLEVTPEGTVLVHQRTFRTARTALRTARRVELRGAPGRVQLVVEQGGGRVDGRRRRRRRATAGLLMQGRTVERSQPPEVLIALADGLDGSRAQHARATAQVLRAQAAHVEAGADLLTSPLAQQSVGFRPLTADLLEGRAGGSQP